MKFCISGFLSLAVLLVAVSSAPAPAPTPAKTPAPTLAPTPAPVPHLSCPPQDELTTTHCLCYPDMKYLICDGTSDTLKFKAKYEFNSLIIKDSPKLPFWSEHFPSADDFKVKALVILQNQKVNITENFKELLRLPSETIKIVANNKITPLDLSYLPPTLTSISISQVPQLNHNYFYHFDLGDETQLKHIHFREVTFNPSITDLFIERLPLTRIEISSSGLQGKFAYIPTVCPVDNDKIIIDLHDNKLTGFNFSYLFPIGGPACDYHIDLSFNPQMDADLLTSQLKTLVDNGKKIFLRLAGLALDCNCELLTKYREKLSSSIHSLVCNKFGPLDEIKDGTDAYKAICPPPPATLPPTTPKPTTIKK